MTRHLVFASGTSAGAAFGGLVTQSDWVSVLAFIGSVVATAIGWILSRRAEITAARIELKHQERQAARDELIADALAELKIRQLSTPATRPKGGP